MPRKGTLLKLQYKTQKELYMVSDMYVCANKSSQSIFKNVRVLRVVSFVD